MMNNQFDLRQQILHTTHQWPIVLLAFILGSILGLGYALFFPAGYRSETRLNVSYNADAIFRNPDDYKNWEMEQLDVLVYSQAVLSETLSQLQLRDSYWQQVTLKNLASKVHVYWRNTGIWRFVAKDKQAQHAVQLVETWTQVTLKVVEQALQFGSELTKINQQIQANTRAQVSTQMRLVELQQIVQALDTWKMTAIQQNPGQIVDELTRWHLYYLASRCVQLNAAGLESLKSFPTEDSSAGAYLSMVDKLLVLINEQIKIAEQQLPLLNENSQNFNQQWNQTYAASWGLSSYLKVEPIGDLAATSQPLRTYPEALLVGGILGLLVWVLIWLAIPFLKRSR